MPGTINVAGAVKILGLPEDACFVDFKDFLSQLTKYLVLEIPQTITNVVIGNQEPSSSQRQDVWFRYDNSGNFLGIYLYTNGEWTLVFPVEPLPDPASGWNEIDEIWQLSSAGSATNPSTISVPADATQKFQIGDKIRITENGIVKYFYVIGVGSTSLVLFGGSDYYLLTDTLTNPAFSRLDVPFAFPDWFHFQPTPPTCDGNTGASVSAYAFSTAIFNLKGRMVTTSIVVDVSVTGGAATASWIRLQLPLVPSTTGGGGFSGQSRIDSGAVISGAVGHSEPGQVVELRNADSTQFTNNNTIWLTENYAI